MNFMVNNVERNTGFDFNGDGYIGGEGLVSKIEKATHIDLNHDNIIGRRPDVYNGYNSFYGNCPQTGYGPNYPTGYGSTFGYERHF